MLKRLKFDVEQRVLFMVRWQMWQALRFKIFKSAHHFSQHRDRGDEGGQRSAACGRQRTDVSSLSARPNRRL